MNFILSSNGIKLISFISGIILLMISSATLYASPTVSPYASPTAQTHNPVNGAPLEVDPKPILDQLREASLNLNEYSVIHIQKELFGEKLGPQFVMKVKYSKGRVYLKMLEGPKKNAELIYVPGTNDNKVKVHKGSFPDINLNLNPHHSLLLEKQHHPIEHMSFKYIVGSVFQSIDRCSSIPGSYGKVLQEDQESSNGTLLVELVSPWQEAPIQVEKDEDIWSFANRLKVDPFVILHANNYDEFDSIPEGKPLSIPRCYATRTLLGIDKKTHLLNRLDVFDKNGKLYESYEWKNLDVSSALTDLDFDPKNPDYEF